MDRNITEITIQQNLERYGYFQCPFCSERANWKWSQSAGHCFECDTMFYYTGGKHENHETVAVFEVDWESMR